MLLRTFSAPLVALLLATIASNATAADSPLLTDISSFGGFLRHVTPTTGSAVLAIEGQSLVMIELSDPAGPRPLLRQPIPELRKDSETVGLATNGRVAILALPFETQIYRILPGPLRFELATRIKPLVVESMTLAGDTLIVTRDDQAWAVNVSDPAAPVFSPPALANTGGRILSSLLADDALLALGPNGLALLDASVAGTLVHRAALPGSEGVIAARGDLIAFGHRDAIVPGTIGIELFNIASPAAPVRVGTLAVAPRALGFIGNDLAVVTERRERIGTTQPALYQTSTTLTLYDIAVTTAPVAVATRDYPGVFHRVVVTDAGIMMTSEHTGLHVVPVENRAFGTQDMYWSPSSESVLLDGNWAWIATWDGLFSADLRNPDLPVIRRVKTFPHYGASLTKGPGQTLLLKLVDTVEVIDISNPLSPTLASTHSADYTGPALPVGSPVFQTGGGTIIRVLDTTNLDSIQTLHELDLRSQIVDFDYDDNRLCVLGRWFRSELYRPHATELTIFDMTDPTSPTTFALLKDAFVSPTSILRSGNMLYLGWASTERGAWIYDLSSPALPILAQTTAPLGFGAFWIDADHYLSPHKLVSVRNRLAPVVIGPAPTGYRTASYDGQRVIFSDYLKGLTLSEFRSEVLLSDSPWTAASHWTAFK